MCRVSCYALYAYGEACSQGNTEECAFIAGILPVSCSGIKIVVSSIKQDTGFIGGSVCKRTLLWSNEFPN